MKSEKEIMRPLYNRYRALKQTLATPNSVIADLFTHSVTLFVNIASLYYGPKFISCIFIKTLESFLFY